MCEFVWLTNFVFVISGIRQLSLLFIYILAGTSQVASFCTKCDGLGYVNLRLWRGGVIYYF